MPRFMVKRICKCRTGMAHRVFFFVVAGSVLYEWMKVIYRAYTVLTKQVRRRAILAIA